MKKKRLCTLIKKYRADWSSQNPHCFTTMWKTYDLRRQTRVHRRARGTQQNLPNKRKHNINISRQKFLKESNTILPNCKPVDKLNPHEHGSCLGAAYPASRTWAAISRDGQHQLLVTTLQFLLLLWNLQSSLSQCTEQQMRLSDYCPHN